MIRKALLLLIPAALKIRQLSQGHGRPQNVPLKGTKAYPQRPGDGEQDGTGDFDSASRGGSAEDRNKIAAITGSWT